MALERDKPDVPDRTVIIPGIAPGAVTQPASGEITGHNPGVNLIVGLETGGSPTDPGSAKIAKVFKVFEPESPEGVAARAVLTYFSTPAETRGDLPEELVLPDFLIKRKDFNERNTLQQLSVGAAEYQAHLARVQAKPDEEERPPERQRKPRSSGGGARKAVRTGPPTAADIISIAPVASKFATEETLIRFTDALRRARDGEAIGDIFEYINPEIAGMPLPAELGGGTVLARLITAVENERKPGIPVTAAAKSTEKPKARERSQYSLNDESLSIESMRSDAVYVLGPSFDPLLWDEIMLTYETVFQKDTPISPSRSPYAEGMARIVTASDQQTATHMTDDEVAYTAARAYVNAEIVTLLGATDDTAEVASLQHTLRLLNSLAKATPNERPALLEELETKEGSTNPRSIRIDQMAHRLALFTQGHIVGTRLTALDDLALIPLLNPSYQQEQAGIVLSKLPILSSAKAVSVVSGERPHRERDRLETEFPLSELDFSDLMAFYCNNLGKLLVQMSMEYGVEYNESLFGRTIEELQEGPYGWPNMDDGKNAMYYAKKPYKWAELVDETDDGKKVILNDYGYEVGRAIAGYLADIALRYPEFNLTDVFGKSGTHHNARITTAVKPSGEIKEYTRHAAILRFKLYEALLANNGEPLAQHELADILGPDFERSTLGATLSKIATKGIIEYIARPANTRFTFFELADPDVEPKIPANKEPTRIIAEWVRTQEGPFNLDNFASVPEHAYLIKVYGNPISEVFAEFVRQGLLKRSGTGFDSETQSAASLTERQAEFLTEVTEALNRVRNGRLEDLQTGWDLADAILQNREAYTTLMRKAKKDSHLANSQPKKTTTAQALEIVTALPGVGSDNIVSAISHIHNKKYTPAYISDVLQDLCEAGIVRIDKIGNKYYYYPQTVQGVEPAAAGPKVQVTAEVDKNALPGRWLAVADQLIHNTYDGSTLPDALRAQLITVGKRRLDDPSYVEAVYDAIRTSPGITANIIHRGFVEKGFGMSTSLVTNIVGFLIDKGYIQIDPTIKGKGKPLVIIEGKE